MKKSMKNNLKVDLTKELNFLKNLFTMFSLPLQKKDEPQLDIDITDNIRPNVDEKHTKRASTILELEERLQVMKSQNNYTLKNKLAKKSLNSKLNKKIKKRERVKLNKQKIKPEIHLTEQKDKKFKPNIPAKPIFNNDGKLVFSKFDFAKLGDKDKGNSKSQKDPKKILDNLKQQEEKIQQLAKVDSEKAKQLKEKAAWKNILQKAEGEKVKDDPTLLKKSIKKLEHKKKVSKNQWQNRIKTVEKKKEESQNRRRENISKKKKEKKAKIVKAAVKRGRVVI